MNNVIRVQIRTVYGIDRFYPVNDQAELLAKLTGTVTLTETNLKTAKAMGFVIEAQRPASPIFEDKAQ
jgi:hypothetical protein